MASVLRIVRTDNFLLKALLSVASVIHGQTRSEDVTWKINSP